MFAVYLNHRIMVIMNISLFIPYIPCKRMLDKKNVFKHKNDTFQSEERSLFMQLALQRRTHMQLQTFYQKLLLHTICSCYCLIHEFVFLISLKM